MNLPPYSFGQAFSVWHFDVVTTGFVLVLAGFYGWRIRRAAVAGTRWPRWRVFLFTVLGLGGIVVSTMSSLAVYQRTVPWPFVVQIALLMTVVPVALAVGDPIGLLRAGCSPTSRVRLDRVLSGAVARIFTFPLVAAVLGVIVEMVLFFGPVLKPALEHGWVMNVVYLVALVTGCLLAWPLLGDDLLPSWCTPPMRLLFAAVDGLLDAIPGIALVSAGTLIAHGYFSEHLPSWSSDAHADQQMAGTLAVAVAEVVAVPLLVVLFFQWARGELRADSADRVGSRLGVAGDDVVGPEARADAEEPTLERPWWETDPSFGRRTDEYRGRPGDS